MLALVVLAPLLVSDVPSPRDHGGWVSDQANLIDAATEARLEETIGAFQGTRGVEIAVVTVGDVVGDPHAWGTDLFNRWGIGRAASDNGVLLLLVMDQRDVEIISGDGIRAALPDEWLRELQGTAMVPAFKMGQFGEGLEAAVVGIIDHLSSTAESGADRGPAPVPGPVPEPMPLVSAPAAPHPTPWLPITGAVLGLGALGAGTALFLRRRRRTCDACHVRMLKLDEIADDAHLDAGQRKEEALGSIDYEVLVCPGCQATRTFAHTRLFSGYTRCPACVHRTARSRSETVVAASYEHGGQIRVTTTCQHCGQITHQTHYTAPRTRPSTTSTGSSSFGSSSHSSHSSRSSFGGGHSSGGGASSKW
jgi:uncharacterized protein